MTGLDIQNSCHRLETICQSQCDGSGIAGCGMSALLQPSPLRIKLEERDNGVHHCWEASGRNMILKRATYKCTIIITIISPHTDHADALLQARLSKQPSPRCLAWSSVYGVVDPALTLSPSPTTAIDDALHA